jgi:hypothetical protein
MIASGWSRRTSCPGVFDIRERGGEVQQPVQQRGSIDPAPRSTEADVAAL